MNNKLLPQKLKELRKVNNYTQDYVAEVLGVVRQTYSHYETGKRTPDAEALYKLAGLYNISIDDLMHLTMNVDRTFPTMRRFRRSRAQIWENILRSLIIRPIKKSTISTRIWNGNCFFISTRFPKKTKKKSLSLQKIKARKPL